MYNWWEFGEPAYRSENNIFVRGGWKLVVHRAVVRDSLNVFHHQTGNTTKPAAPPKRARVNALNYNGINTTSSVASKRS